MRRKPGKKEQGVVMVLFVLSLPILFAFAALAVDIGRMYAARQNLNKATRVAALVALNFMSLRGWGALVTDDRDNGLGYQTGPIVARGSSSLNPPQQPTTTSDLLLQEMAQAVATTMRDYYPGDFSADSYGNLSSSYLQFSVGDSSLSGTVPLAALHLGDSSVRLNIHYGVPTILYGRFMPLISGMNSCRSEGSGGVRCWVQNSPAEPAGFLKQLNLFLLLDTSGSMAGTTGNGTNKIDVLKEAVANFIDMFNPFKDNIAVIDYGTTVKTAGRSAPFNGQLTTFERVTGTNPHLDIKYGVQALQTGGQTNPCDALVTSLREAYGRLNPDLATAVVLFTDGSPNTARLKYCDFSGGTCNTPSRLSSAISLSGASANPEDGWYSWITKWGRRELSSCRNGVSVDPNPAQRIRDCDPVYGWPELAYGSGPNAGTLIDPASIRANLRLHEDGIFVWLHNSREIPITTPDPELPNGPYILQFKTLSGAQDNHKWYGPSYLVHASTPPAAGMSLLDRIPATTTPAPITCGPGSRPSYPGSLDSTEPPNTREMHTHPHYFASRNINYLWSLDASGGTNDPHAHQRRKVGLEAIDRNGPITAPDYFMVRNPSPLTLKNAPPQSPGCLTSLDAQVPYTSNSANIFLGEQFLSNPTDASIQSVGEVVKSSELPYYCAVRAADYLRSQYGAIVFVVGLGPRAADIYDENGAACEDPMQNVLDFDSRKDNFLRRLAFAPESLRLTEVDDFIRGDSASWDPTNDFGLRARTLSSCNAANHPLADQTLTLGYGERLSASNTPTGQSPNEHNFTPRHFGGYYGCNDSSQLNEVFGNIAKQILLRLAT